mmetsp:Transcript_57754/g.118181  ORF Transcript_57754/g.118181 Transcript_57754/m.118181 type:complete len:203 (+) Transcript_57754:567-1175(+)
MRNHRKNTATSVAWTSRSRSSWKLSCCRLHTGSASRRSASARPRVCCSMALLAPARRSWREPVQPRQTRASSSWPARSWCRCSLATARSLCAMPSSSRRRSRRRAALRAALSSSSTSSTPWARSGLTASSPETGRCRGLCWSCSISSMGSAARTALRWWQRRTGSTSWTPRCCARGGWTARSSSRTRRRRRARASCKYTLAR